MDRAYGSGPGRRYEITWEAAGDGAGRVRLADGPGGGTTLEIVVADAGDWVVMHDDALSTPPPGSIEVRVPGLWFVAVELDPGRQLQLGLEAHAVRVDALPDDLAGIRGVPAAVGLDLEVYRDAAAVVAIGDVLVDDRVHRIDHPATWEP